MLASKIKARAMQLGYLGCGIIPASELREYKKYIDERIKVFPESKEFYDSLYGMAEPPENAKSVIVCTQNYTKYRVSESLSGLIGVSYMFEGRLPFAPDYRTNAEFEGYIQTLGVNILKFHAPARLSAAKAGLGKYGRNTFMYDPKHGSYIWIDTWVVDKELEYDTVADDVFLSACSDGCQKCIGACPTKALASSYVINRGRCINQLACYTGNGIPDEDTRVEMGRWLYGCEVCQKACPMNKDVFTGNEEFPLLAEIEEYMQPERVLEMDEETYVNIVSPRFWYIGAQNMWLWKCNALRSMINSGDSKYHDFIRKYQNDADPRISEMARWGCVRLGI